MLYNLPTLTKETYQRWKFDMKAALESIEVLNIVDGSTLCPVLLADNSNANAVSTWKKGDAKARLIISSSLDTDHHAAIRFCSNSKQMWDTIISLREQNTETNKYLANQEFHQYRFDQGMTVSSYFSGMAIIKQNIESIGENITEAALIAKVINDLPKEYDFFRQSYRIAAAAGTTLTLSNIQAQLQVVEQDLKNKHENPSDAGEALVTKVAEKKKQNHKKTNNDKEKRTCWKCGKQGHLKINCKTKSTGQTDTSQQKGLLMQEDGCCVGSWKGDSGCSSHMTRDKNSFANLILFDHPVNVTVGDGSKMLAKARGTVVAELFDGTNWNKREILNVLWVPNLCEEGLISLGVLTERGFTVELKGKVLNVYDKDKIILTGVRGFNHLYSLKIRINSEVAHIAIDSLRLWHERLAHISPKTIEKMAKSEIVDGLEKINMEKDYFCEGCAMGKMHKQPYKSRSSKCEEAGSVIHADLCGKMEVESLSRSRYYLELKDEASGYTKVYFIRSKHQVFNKLKQFVADQRSETGKVMKTFFSDGGMEFDNDGVKQFFLQHGIKHQMSAPYNPQQNGRAERENRTLVDHARCMLYAKGLPKELWAEAINTTAYILNRVPASGEDKTPYEKWFGKKPSIRHLRVFGTNCYTLIPKQLRKKWESKSRRGKLVGYTDTDKNFRIWDEEKRRVDICRDVKFDNTSELNNTARISLDIADKSKIHNCGPSSGQPNVNNLREKKEDEEDEDSDESEFYDANTPGRHTNSKNNKNEGVQRNLRDRSKLQAPRRYDEHCFLTMSAPRDYEEAIKSEDSKYWIAAMKEEYESLLRNKTWEMMELPQDRSPIQCKWVFSKKERPNSTQRYKARLVAKGFSQKAGIDYGETFAPVMKMDSIRIILSLANWYNLKTVHLDVKTAFLYGDLEEELYLKQPEGFNDGTNQVCRLKKGLYGLKQASRTWNKKLNSFLEDFGMKAVTSDQCVYFMKTDNVIVMLGIYVDDGLLCSNSENTMSKILKHIKEHFEITVEEANCFVGLQIERDEINNTLKIHQKSYIEKLLKRFNMENCKGQSTPMDVNSKLVKSTDKSTNDDNYPYKEAVGSLIYLMIGSRPDIAYSVGKLSQFMDSYDHTHWRAVKHLFRYLKNTMDLKITYYKDGTNKLEGFCDSDYAGDQESRKSTSGYIFMLNGGAVSWSSKLQRIIALSTTEAEYISLAEATKQSIWLRQLLIDLHQDQEAIQINCDNQGALKLVQNPEDHQRTKHIDVRYHFVRDMQKKGIISVEYLESEKQLADILTKPLPGPRLKNCLRLINM